MNSDIAYCEGGDCPIKDKCRRFLLHIGMQGDSSAYVLGVPPYFVVECGFYIGAERDKATTNGKLMKTEEGDYYLGYMKQLAETERMELYG